MRAIRSSVAVFLALAFNQGAAFSASTTAGPNTASAPAADPMVKRLDMLKAQPISAQSIFSDASFPKIDLVNRDLVEAAAGPVSEKVRFFDAQWNEVTAPKTPGRYGALVTFAAGAGLSWTRHFTFYKTPEPYNWAKETYRINAEFPAAFGISPELAASEQWNIQNGLGFALGESEGTSDFVARLLAALQTISSDPARWHGFNISSIENAWWSELQRRLGENQDYPYLSHLPDGYARDTKAWPLLVFLHGSGERGSDLSKLKNQGPLGYIN